eukprot:3256430-Rhodomonas_salina.1
MARGLRRHPAIRGEAWVGMSVSGLEPEAAPGYPWGSLVLPLTVRRRHSTTAVLQAHSECVNTNVRSSTGSSVDYAVSARL